jgi:hypothetical protein
MWGSYLIKKNQGIEFKDKLIQSRIQNQTHYNIKKYKHTVFIFAKYQRAPCRKPNFYNVAK